MSRQISARMLIVVVATMLTVIAGAWLSLSTGNAAGQGRAGMCQVPAAANPTVDETAACIVDRADHTCCTPQFVPQAIPVAAVALVSRSAPVPTGIVPDDWLGVGRQLLPELTPPRPPLPL